MACGYCGKPGHNVKTCPKKFMDIRNNMIRRQRLEDVEAKSSSPIKSPSTPTWIKKRKMAEPISSSKDNKKIKTSVLPLAPYFPLETNPVDVTKAGPFNTEDEFRAHQQLAREGVERRLKYNALQNAIYNSPSDFSIPKLSTPSGSVPPTRGKKGYPSSSWVFKNTLKGGKTRKNKRKGGTKDSSANTLMNWTTPLNNKKFYIPHKSNISPQLPPLTPPSPSSPIMSPREELETSNYKTLIPKPTISASKFNILHPEVSKPGVSKKRSRTEKLKRKREREEASRAYREKKGLTKRKAKSQEPIH
jgi:hypothetical protein